MDLEQILNDDTKQWWYCNIEKGKQELMIRDGSIGFNDKEWDKDLKQCDNIEDLKKIYKNSKMFQSIQDFYQNAKIGDLVFIGNDKGNSNISKKTISRIAIIEGDYFYYQGEYCHRRKVKYLDKKDFDFIFNFKGTLGIYFVKIDNEYRKILHNLLTNKEKRSIQDIQNYSPLNQILYGSPGTGKTYNTIDRALCILGYGAIVNQECKLDYQKIRDSLKTIKTQETLGIDIDKSNDRTCAKTLFDYYHNEGQIEFVTFHQNYGYEEFVEGIKPDFDEENKNVKYEIKEGIFKVICRKANDNLTKSKINQNISIKQTEQMRQNIADFCKSIQEELWENETYDLGDDVNIKEITYNKNGDIHSFILGGSVTSEQSLTVDMLRRDYLDILHQKIQYPKNIKPRYKSNREHHGNAGYYFKLYKKFEKFLKNKNTTPQAESLKPYILIIDEINRGNISKIFGELITLIEPSKRIGADEELRVTLPYSGSQAENGETKELFGVPSNLYIIGTMNTADRSITSLDTALRRRFEFVEMMPDSETLTNLKVSHENQDTEINLAKLLQAINDRIEFLYDREKTIGHAFFLSEDKDHKRIITLEQLKGIFQNKIIPLLQEYFYNDYEAIQAVLNDNGMIRLKDSKSEKQDFLAMEKFKAFVNDRGLDEKKVFEITPRDEGKVWNNPSTYTKIYGVDGDNKTQPNGNEPNTLSSPSNN